jgi:transketolase
MDAVEQADSGHPGTPMALAPAAYVLWRHHLKHAPTDPWWADRDRFVLSCGHASMLLYSLLHLSGYDLPLEEIRQFRQWGSRTPGHPEWSHTVGVRVHSQSAARCSCNRSDVFPVFIEVEAAAARQLLEAMKLGR